jgi:hypothetical protein
MTKKAGSGSASGSTSKCHGPEHWFGNALTWQAERAGLALEEARVAALVATRVHQSSSLPLVECDAAARAHATAICKEKKILTFKI